MVLTRAPIYARRQPDTADLNFMASPPPVIAATKHLKMPIFFATGDVSFLIHRATVRHTYGAGFALPT